MPADIKLKIEYDAIKLYFDGVLHLYIKRPELVGVQSWVIQNAGKYVIEWTLKDGVVTCEYDDFEKFKLILSLIDPVLRY